jgi:hypothetical protein
MALLNKEQLSILQAIKEGKSRTDIISDFTKLSVNLVRYYQTEMQKQAFIRCFQYRVTDGELDYECYLQSKGEVALENPDFLLKAGQVDGRQTHIYAQNVGLVNSGDGKVTDFSLNIGQRINEVNNLINSLRQAAEEFPSDQREDFSLALEDLESDLSQPDKRQPKRIQRRVQSLLGIVHSVLTSVSDIAGLINNIQELATKLGISI